MNMGPNHDGRLMPIFQERLLQIGKMNKPTWTYKSIDLLVHDHVCVTRIYICFIRFVLVGKNS